MSKFWAADLHIFVKQEAETSGVVCMCGRSMRKFGSIPVVNRSRAVAAKHTEGCEHHRPSGGLRALIQVWWTTGFLWV